MKGGAREIERDESRGKAGSEDRRKGNELRHQTKMR